MDEGGLILSIIIIIVVLVTVGILSSIIRMGVEDMSGGFILSTIIIRMGH